MILHYDTETTGINLHGVPSNDPRQPHIVSLSAVLDDDQGVTRRVMSVIVRNSGIVIDERLMGDDGKPTAFSIHGITNAMAEKFGVPLSDALMQFHQMCRPGTLLSGFNVLFDWKMIKIACARIDATAGEAMRQFFEDHISTVCTMEAAASNLIGKKRISLKNAYFEMFKQEIQLGHHGSLEDTMASRRVYWELVRRGHPMVPKSLAAKVYDTPYVAAS